MLHVLQPSDSCSSTGWFVSLRTVFRQRIPGYSWVTDSSQNQLWPDFDDQVSQKSFLIELRLTNSILNNKSPKCGLLIHVWRDCLFQTLDMHPHWPLSCDLLIHDLTMYPQVKLLVWLVDHSVSTCPTGWELLIRASNMFPQLELCIYYWLLINDETPLCANWLIRNLIICLSWPQ